MNTGKLSVLMSLLFVACGKSSSPPPLSTPPAAKSSRPSHVVSSTDSAPAKTAPEDDASSAKVASSKTQLPEAKSQPAPPAPPAPVGSFDFSFGQGKGYESIGGINQTQGLMISYFTDSSKRIYAVQRESGDAFVTRILPNGKLDTTFANNGYLNTIHTLFDLRSHDSEITNFLTYVYSLHPDEETYVHSMAFMTDEHDGLMIYVSFEIARNQYRSYLVHLDGKGQFKQEGTLDLGTSERTSNKSEDAIYAFKNGNFYLGSSLGQTATLRKFSASGEDLQFAAAFNRSSCGKSDSIYGIGDFLADRLVLVCGQIKNSKQETRDLKISVATIDTQTGRQLDSAHLTDTNTYAWTSGHANLSLLPAADASSFFVLTNQFVSDFNYAPKPILIQFSKTLETIKTENPPIHDAAMGFNKFSDAISLPNGRTAYQDFKDINIEGAGQDLVTFRLPLEKLGLDLASASVGGWVDGEYLYVIVATTSLGGGDVGFSTLRMRAY